MNRSVKNIFSGFTVRLIISLYIAAFIQYQALGATPTKAKKGAEVSKKAADTKASASTSNTTSKAQGKKQVYNTKFGTVTVETLSNPDDPMPKYNIETEHYKIYSEMKAMDPVKDIGTILEAAYPYRVAFFGSEPKEKPILVEMYASADNYYAAGKAQGVPVAGGGYYWTGTKKAYLYWQSAGVYFTRYLMLHETGHQFDYLTGGGKFPVESIAEYMGIHRWDGTNFVMGIAVPGEWILGDRPKTALKNINDYVQKNGQPKDIESMFQASSGYEGSWAFIHFLINRDPAGLKTMYQNCKKGISMNDSWKQLYGASSLKPDVFPAYTNWLEKMKTYKDTDISFTSWDIKIAGDPTSEIMAKINNLSSIIGDNVPALSSLRDKVEALKKRAMIANSSKSSKNAGPSASNSNLSSIKSEAKLLWNNSVNSLCKDICASKAPPEKIDEAMKQLIGQSINVKVTPDAKENASNIVVLVTVTASNLSSTVMGTANISISPLTAGISPTNSFPFRVSRAQQGQFKALIPITERAGKDLPIELNVKATLQSQGFSFPISTVRKWKRDDPS